MTVGAVTILTQMFYEPGKAFESLRDGRPGPWLPVLATALLTAALFYWYFGTVDFNWLVDNMAASRPDLKPAEAAAMREHMSPGMMMWSAVGGSLIMVPLSFALFGVYYLIASKFLGSEKKFGDWFSFSAWASVPTLLTLPLMALQIATGGGQVSVEDLNMANLNYLLFHFPASHPWFNFASGISLTTLWVLALSVIGLRVWTRRSLAACVVTAVVPVALIYGLWAAKIAFFG